MDNNNLPIKNNDEQPTKTDQLVQPLENSAQIPTDHLAQPIQPLENSAQIPTDQLVQPMQDSAQIPTDHLAQPAQYNTEIQTDHLAQPMQDNAQLPTDQPVQQPLNYNQQPNYYQPPTGVPISNQTMPDQPDFGPPPPTMGYFPPPPPTPSSFVLSIVGLASNVLIFCGCCCIFIPIPVGLIISIISMAMANSQIKKGDQHPKLKTAKTLSLIGILVGVLLTLAMTCMFILNIIYGVY